MAITILMKMPLRPDADNIDEVLRHDLPATAEFEGNEGTEVITDNSEPHTLYLLSRWSSDDAYEKYSAWRQSPEGVTRLGEISSGAPTFRKFHTYMLF
ncbi:antibiotic biosynthesis monooxygenase family protein [Rhodococcus wratislaviensis]|uniref:antibiotic biosynthesis monooxygenase family protein n=1 Tax=Rhodococcus wratislaviensis TaxID=44752 RepID=UPI0036631CF0